MRRLVRIALYLAAALAALALIAFLAAVLIIPSQWFHDKVRDRIVSEVERSTGGRAEIGSFTFDWRSLKARIAPFTLHGTEPAGEALAPRRRHRGRLEVPLRRAARRRYRVTPRR